MSATWLPAESLFSIVATIADEQRNHQPLLSLKWTKFCVPFSLKCAIRNFFFQDIYLEILYNFCRTFFLFPNENYETNHEIILIFFHFAISSIL